MKLLKDNFGNYSAQKMVNLVFVLAMLGAVSMHFFGKDDVKTCEIMGKLVSIDSVQKRDVKYTVQSEKGGDLIKMEDYQPDLKLGQPVCILYKIESGDSVEYEYSRSLLEKLDINE